MNDIILDILASNFFGDIEKGNPQLDIGDLIKEWQRVCEIECKLFGSKNCKMTHISAQGAASLSKRYNLQGDVVDCFIQIKKISVYHLSLFLQEQLKRSDPHRVYRTLHGMVDKLVVDCKALHVTDASDASENTTTSETSESVVSFPSAPVKCNTDNADSDSDNSESESDSDDSDCDSDSDDSDSNENEVFDSDKNETFSESEMAMLKSHLMRVRIMTGTDRASIEEKLITRNAFVMLKNHYQMINEYIDVDSNGMLIVKPVYVSKNLLEDLPDNATYATMYLKKGNGFVMTEKMLFMGKSADDPKPVNIVIGFDGTNFIDKTVMMLFPDKQSIPRC